MPDIDLGGGNTFSANNGGVSQDDHDRGLAMAIEMREMEVYQYQINIANYEGILASLPSAQPWPQRLQPYRGMSRDQLAANIESDADLELASQLSFRDEIRLRIRTERMECNKSRAMLETAVASAPDIAKIRALITEIKAARINL
jgi:hypothetical protein